MAKLVVHVPLEDWNKLDAKARERGTNKSMIVRELLRPITDAPPIAGEDGK